MAWLANGAELRFSKVFSVYSCFLGGRCVDDSCSMMIVHDVAVSLMIMVATMIINMVFKVSSFSSLKSATFIARFLPRYGLLNSHYLPVLKDRPDHCLNRLRH